MTKKELEELVKKQSEQISELISLVQKKEKEVVIVRESGTKPWNPSPTSPWPSPVFPYTPTSPLNPYVTWCDTAPEKHTLTVPQTFLSTPLPDGFKDKPFNDFGDGKFQTWDKEPYMLKAWDRLGIIGHDKSEGMV